MNSGSAKRGFDFEVRRIFLENEANEIRALQSKAPELYNHYPNHSEWLDEAINAVIIGKKVAFGVYKATLSSNSRPSVELVGSVILKRELYTDIVEMKNLFIREDCRGDGYGTELCNAAEKHCAKGGYSTIKTEVPAEEFKTINFLIRRGYRLFTTKESRYKQGEYLYEMYKDIFPHYGGDYFDLYELALWLLKYVYGFSNIDSNRDDNTITFNLNLKVPLNSNIKNKNVVPKGIVIVFDKDEIVNKETINKIYEEAGGYNLAFVFGRNFSQDAIIECGEKGILLFDEISVHESFRDLFVYNPSQFKKEEISGIIVSVNPVYFQRIKTQTSAFTYYKGGYIGKYLKKGNKVLFFSEPSSKYPKGGVRGYGEVVEVYGGPPVSDLDKHHDRNSIFTKSEYKTFAENKEIILGIVISDFREISPISYPELKNEKIVGEEVDVEDLGHYYISEGMLNRFYEIKKEIEDGDVDFNPDAPRVFISSTFDDLKTERKSLKNCIKHDLRYNVYAFETGGSGHPARSHILGKLKKSDVYICLIGGRYGSEFDRGGKKISATEDEYDNAKEWHIPIRVYLKNVPERDEKTNEFLKKIGEDYKDASLWQKFTTVEELIEYAKNDIAELWKKMREEHV